ncbi:MAG: dihydrofolate reductase family protein [Bacteroidales bacterium]|jgi:dihydrofolate reductase|nr:dihydrofolate reductase family protein [Bacteroidales bacterium]
MDVIWSYPNQHTYVVSQHEWNAHENVSFIAENIIETIYELRNQKGKDIWLVGGGELISMLLTANLIDEMQITYMPVIPFVPRTTQSLKMGIDKKFQV